MRTISWNATMIDNYGKTMPFFWHIWGFALPVASKNKATIQNTSGDNVFAIFFEAVKKYWRSRLKSLEQWPKVTGTWEKKFWPRKGVAGLLGCALWLRSNSSENKECYIFAFIFQRYEWIKTCQIYPIQIEYKWYSDTLSLKLILIYFFLIFPFQETVKSILRFFSIHNKACNTTFASENLNFMELFT